MQGRPSPRVPRRSRSGRTGQGLVEFALAIPIFLLVALALAEGAAYALTTTTLQTAAQHGARLAALPTTSDLPTVTSAVIDRADLLTVTSGQVSVSVNGGATAFADRETGDRVRVTISYSHQPLSAMVFGGLTFALVADSEYVVE